MHNQDPLDQALSRLYAKSDVPEGFETGWRAAIRREESKQRMTSSNRFSRWMRRLAPVCAAVVLVCGALTVGAMEEELYTPAPEPMMAADMAAPSNGVMLSMSRSGKEAPAELVEEAAYDMLTDGSGEVMAGGSIHFEGETIDYVERKLVRTIDITLHTQDFDNAAATVQAQLLEMEGYVENLYQYGESLRRLNLSMRVPAHRLDAFVQSVEGVGRLTDRSESTTDMTTQYKDNLARLETLYAKRDRLNELMKQAEAVSDLIEIESAIADTQYQIDLYETSRREIDQQVSMSAVHVTLVEEKAAETANAAQLSLGARLRAALKASVEWTGEFLRDMAVFVVMILPVAIPAAVIAVIVILIRRRKKKA